MSAWVNKVTPCFSQFISTLAVLTRRISIHLLWFALSFKKISPLTGNPALCTHQGQSLMLELLLGQSFLTFVAAAGSLLWHQ